MLPSTFMDVCGQTMASHKFNTSHNALHTLCFGQSSTYAPNDEVVLHLLLLHLLLLREGLILLVASTHCRFHTHGITNMYFVRVSPHQNERYKCVKDCYQDYGLKNFMKMLSNAVHVATFQHACLAL